MWASSNKFQSFNAGGDRPLGDYTQQQRELEAFYNLAQSVAKKKPDGVVYADVNVADNTYEIAKGSDMTALAYGLQPYLVAPKYDSLSLVTEMPNSEGGVTRVARTMLRRMLYKIVEDA